MRKYILLFIVSISSINLLFAQAIGKEKFLINFSKERKAKEDLQLSMADSFASIKQWPKTISGGTIGFAKLIGVNNFHHPIYYSTFNNIDVARTSNTNQLWQGGRLGISLSGNSSNIKNKLAIWDGGRVLDTHVELIGRIKRMDSSYYNGGGSDHATHVTGTMMAKGINPLAKGMAYNLQGLLAYEFTNDISEMSSVANSLLVSNHSYGLNCGWTKDGGGQWFFWGYLSDKEDYNFGYYDQSAADYDNIAYNAPYYLIVKAAGNNRNSNGPAVGQSFNYYDSLGNYASGIRPAGISSNNSYGIIGTNGNSKNIITVGAVNAITNGYTKPSDVEMSKFSSWGPTDDGRIKPDLVADGVNVLSTFATGNSDYDFDDGTSMSAPCISGSLMLLQELYSQKHGGRFMLASTLKGLAIHTANEAGSFQGPDYQFGWGLLNTEKAAEAIITDAVSNHSFAGKHIIIEDTLQNGTNFSKMIKVSKTGKLTATLSWTDPAGNVETTNILNNPTPKLVNDLDIRVKVGNKTYLPWVLNPNVPAAAATKGDNILDNVEQIIIDTINKGDSFAIQISHKGNLYSNTPQAFALIITQPYDTTLPLKLVSFKANKLEKTILLKWQTIQEENMQSFSIEKSINGSDWITVKTINAQNTLQLNTYSFEDISPSNGISYYRLKMINKDGSFTYSAIEKIVFQSGIVSSKFFIAPNPANNITKITLQNAYKAVQLRIVDGQGKIWKNQTITLNGKKEYYLNIASLANGFYTISLFNEQENIGSQPLMILK